MRRRDFAKLVEELARLRSAISCLWARLALKIRYPGMARSITSDVDNVAVLLRLLNLLPLDLDVDAIAGEAARELLDNRLQTAKVRGSYVS